MMPLLWRSYQEDIVNAMAGHEGIVLHPGLDDLTASYLTPHPARIRCVHKEHTPPQLSQSLLARSCWSG